MGRANSKLLYCCPEQSKLPVGRQWVYNKWMSREGNKLAGFMRFPWVKLAGWAFKLGTVWQKWRVTEDVQVYELVTVGGELSLGLHPAATCPLQWRVTSPGSAHLAWTTPRMEMKLGLHSWVSKQGCIVISLPSPVSIVLVGGEKIAIYWGQWRAHCFASFVTISLPTVPWGKGELLCID